MEDVQAIVAKWDLRARCEPTVTTGWPNYTPEEQRRSDAIRQVENELRSTAKALAWRLVDADEEIRTEDIMAEWVCAGQIVRQLDYRLRRVVGE